MITIKKTSTKTDSNSWSLDYYDYNPGKEEYARESLLTTGNGFIGLRGTVPGMTINDDHYPATYLAGLYNETVSMVSGREIANEDFVNAPDFQYLTISIDNEIILFTKDQVKDMERHLDLKSGLFSGKVTVVTEKNKEALISFKKFVSMANRNQYGIFYEITPINFSGEIQISSQANGDVYNYNVERYRSLNTHHLVMDELATHNNTARMAVHTTTSELRVIQESKLLSDCDLEWENQVEEKRIIQKASVFINSGQCVSLEKLVFVEKALCNDDIDNISGMNQLSSFDEMYKASKVAWEILWNKSDIQIDGDVMSEKLLHLHTYHLLVSASPLSAKDLDVSVTARGLHGEAYRGHIFWDELYIMPFYIIHFPQTARQLLMYRYRRLCAAKKAAKEEGREGAMFPWQSGLDGTEQSQQIHLNPLTGNWDDDNSRLQRHVSLAIAYNIWLYYKNTGDWDYMNQYGMEMLLEIVKFWISMSNFDEKKGRYSISGVMGPDEFHESYPGATTGGVKDNAYTNIMVAWLFNETKKLLTELSDEVKKNIKEKTFFTQDFETRMEKIMNCLNLEIDEDGIIAQFDGYFDLKTIDWDYYRKKYGDIQRMDRILRADGKSADEYQVAKQADSLMTFYNLDKPSIDTILCQLNYRLPEDYFDKNLNYYLKRTSHGSTLSRVVHTKLAAMVNNRELSWKLFQESLYSDYEDIQGGTTAEGIHTGVMAATVYIALNTYGGIDIRQNTLIINPSLPEQWKQMKFNIEKNGIQYNIVIEKNKLEITADKDSETIISGTKNHLIKNQKKTVYLK